MPLTPKYRIRTKIMIPVAILAALPVIGILLISDWRIQKSIDYNIQTVTQQRFSVFKKTLEQLNDKALTIGAMMANLPEVRRGYEAYSSDSINLNESSMVIQNSVEKVLADVEKISGSTFRLHFHSSKPSSFYRTWSDKADDFATDRKSLTIVSRARRAVSGFEIGPYGVYIRGIAPIFSNDQMQYYGAVEALLDLEILMQKSVTSQRDQFALFLHNDKVSMVNKKLLSDNFIEKIGGFSFVAYSSNNFRLTHLNGDQLERAFTTKSEFEHFYSHGFYYAGLPITDISGQKIGVVMLQLDISEFVEHAMLIRVAGLLASLFFYVLSVLALYFIVGYLTDPSRRMLGHILKLSQGQLVGEIENLPHDEIGQMGRAINRFVVRINKLVLFSKEITAGRYSVVFEQKNPKDELGKALIAMQKQLKKVEEHRIAREEQDALNNWLNEGRARIGEILRENIDNREKLSNTLISFLVKYFKANQGGVFVLDDERPDVLTMAAAYAYGRKKHLQREFTVGQGLIGVCAFEREVVYMTEVPDDYVEIQSGLGGANPSVLLLLPLLFNDELYGVLEIASFHAFEEHEINFLKTMSETIASSLSTVKINLQTATLLKKYQAQSAEIEKKEHKMQQSIEEMELAKLEANHSEKRLKRYVETLDRTVLRLTIDFSGNVTDLNHTFIDFGGWEKEEVLGNHFLDLVSRADRNKILKKWTEFLGEERGSLRTEVKLYTQKGLRWVSGSFSRTFNKERNKEVFVFIGMDIHEVKRNEIIHINTLKALKTSLLYTEFDTLGTLSGSNDLFVKALGFDRDQLKRVNLFKWVDAEARTELKKLWVRLEKGYPVYRTEMFRTNFSTEKWFQSTYIPIFNEQNTFYMVLHLASDVSLLKNAADKESLVEAALKEQTEKNADLDLELHLAQNRLEKAVKDMEFFKEEQVLRSRTEKLEAENRKEELKKEIVQLHMKIEQLELDRNIQKINYEKQIQTLSAFFEEDRKRLNRTVVKLERELSLSKGRRNVNF